MGQVLGDVLTQLLQGSAQMRATRIFVAFVPVALLAAFWAGGETALLSTALVLPVLGFFAPFLSTQSKRLDTGQTHGPLTAHQFNTVAAQVFDQAQREQMNSAIFMLEIDEPDVISERFGSLAEEKVFGAVGDRLRAVLRGDDVLARWSDHCFAICMAPGRRTDLEAAIQLSGRMSAAAAEPIIIDGCKVFVSASCGFCLLSRAPNATAADWIEASRVALSEARKSGGATTRSYSKDMQAARIARADLREEVTSALENGEIVPWFQPQISTDTGEITGFEALARWQHPTKGTLPPPAFLSAIEEAGLMDKLCYTILSQSLEALRGWDRAGLNVPQVGVNFSGNELMLPNLVDQIAWELDRFDISADRLAVEVLETVMANSPEDLVVRNITGLRKLGCKIDLDDFGTGHASLTAIRRFSVNRIKIDRSFVMKADCDPDQQQMISAILMMAEQLQVETLAEGVETTGEHALLSQLGCDYVQGFGISRPLPFEDTLPWITDHQRRIGTALKMRSGKI